MRNVLRLITIICCLLVGVPSVCAIHENNNKKPYEKKIEKSFDFQLEKNIIEPYPQQELPKL